MNIFKKLLVVIATSFAVINSPALTNQVTLFWNKNPETDIAKYNLYRAEGSNAPVKISIPHPTTTVISTGLIQGRTYTFTLTAENEVGLESAESEPIVHYNPFLLPTISVTNVTVTKVANQWQNVTVRWNAVDQGLYANGPYTLYVENRATGGIQQFSTTSSSIVIPSLPVENYGLTVTTTNWHGSSPTLEKSLSKTPPQRPTLSIRQ